LETQGKTGQSRHRHEKSQHRADQWPMAPVVQFVRQQQSVDMDSALPAFLGKPNRPEDFNLADRPAAQGIQIVIATGEVWFPA
jgi:hypothetical protein